jgi:hypothetical protein
MVMNHGKAVGGTIGATAGATIGAALGAFAGPIGIMIGGAIGQYAGQKIGEVAGTESKAHMRSSLTKITNNMENTAGKNALLTLKGDFSTKEMKQLSEALADGKLHERELKNKNLIEKLNATGNESIFEKHARGGLLIGKSHANGGIKTYGHEFEGGEFIINSGSASRSMGLLNGINDGKINDSNIKSIEPMGKQMKVKESYSQNNSQQTMKMEPLTININGTIKLETNDKTFDISDELFKNPTLINKLTDIITKQINIDDNFAFDRKNYRRKYSIF